jgi:hypothetical protein
MRGELSVYILWCSEAGCQDCLQAVIEDDLRSQSVTTQAVFSAVRLVVTSSRTQSSVVLPAHTVSRRPLSLTAHAIMPATVLRPTVAEAAAVARETEAPPGLSVADAVWAVLAVYEYLDGWTADRYIRESL